MIRHESIKANGLSFHCAVAGDGPLMLLLHGFPQCWYSWRHQIEPLARRHKVVVPDLRGYGDSDKPRSISDYALSQLTGDVAGLIRAFGEERAALVGHDWGGAVAWATALERPEMVERLAVLNCPRGNSRAGHAHRDGTRCARTCPPWESSRPVV
jgi:pimeloyl-ACP methyl ester carboxylesterase